MRTGVVLLLSFLHGLCQAGDFDHPHHLSVIIGGTHVLNDDHTGETIGLDYEYRVSRLLGVGAVAEHAFHEVDATTFLAVADIHSYSGFVMQAGPGVEFAEHGTRFVFRIGGLYEFEMDKLTFSPQFHFDIASNAEDSLVFGMAFGSHF